MVSRGRAMSVLERAASAEVVDDIVLPFAVESLSMRGRLVRLGPAIDLLLKRHDYPAPVSKLVAEAVALAALLGSTLEDGRPFPVADQERWAGHHALGRFRRAVELARACAVRQDAARARCRSGRAPARPGPYGLHHRPGRRDDALPGGRRARGPGIGRGRASLLRAIGADPDAGAPCGWRNRHPERRRLARRRPRRPVSAGGRRPEAQGGLPPRRRA